MFITLVSRDINRPCLEGGVDRRLLGRQVDQLGESRCLTHLSRFQLHCADSNDLVSC